MRSPTAKGFGIAIASIGLLLAAACSSPAPSGGDDTGTESNQTTPSTGKSNGNGSSSNGSSSNGSSASNGNGNSGSSGTQGSSGSSSSGSSSNDAGSGGTTTTGNDSQCAAMQGDACGTCCETAHPQGVMVLDNAFFSCVCGAQGVCQQQCAQSDCAANPTAPQQGDACDTCEQGASNANGTGSCDQQLDSACNADTDCAALYKCYDSCPQ